MEWPCCGHSRPPRADRRHAQGLQPFVDGEPTAGSTIRRRGPGGPGAAGVVPQAARRVRGPGRRARPDPVPRPRGRSVPGQGHRRRLHLGRARHEDHAHQRHTGASLHVELRLPAEPGGPPSPGSAPDLADRRPSPRQVSRRSGPEAVASVAGPRSTPPDQPTAWPTPTQTAGNPQPGGAPWDHGVHNGGHGGRGTKTTAARTTRTSRGNPPISMAASSPARERSAGSSRRPRPPGIHRRSAPRARPRGRRRLDDDGSFQGGGPEGDSKPDLTPVSDADQAVEEAIRRTLRAPARETPSSARSTA